MPIALTKPESDADWRAARALIEEYGRSLGVDLSFQNFADELERLPREYGPPGGALLLAREGDCLLGCIVLRQFSGSTGEIKRLYVPPAARGRGLGRMLAEAILEEAKHLGYRKLLLDTLPSMTAAHRLYAELGFRPTEPYRFNPVGGTSDLELPLE